MNVVLLLHSHGIIFTIWLRLKRFSFQSYLKTNLLIIVSRGALIVKRMNTCMLCFLKT